VALYNSSTTTLGPRWFPVGLPEWDSSSRGPGREGSALHNSGWSPPGTPVFRVRPLVPVEVPRKPRPVSRLDSSLSRQYGPANHTAYRTLTVQTYLAQISSNLPRSFMVSAGPVCYQFARNESSVYLAGLCFRLGCLCFLPFGMVVDACAAHAPSSTKGTTRDQIDCWFGSIETSWIIEGIFHTSVCVSKSWLDKP
jgi:hypothetical protein